MPYNFRWNDWNLDHATQHGVSVVEAESVVNRNHGRKTGGGKIRVVGRGTGGRWIQVVFSLDDNGSVFIIHARPLTDREKKHERKQP